MKFELGQKVKVTADGEVGVVIGFSYDPVAKQVRYTLTSKEVDLGLKEVVHGVKNCLEDELETVKEKVKPK